MVANGLKAPLCEDGLSDGEDPAEEPSVPQLNGIDGSGTQTHSEKRIPANDNINIQQCLSVLVKDRDQIELLQTSSNAWFVSCLV